MEQGQQDNRNDRTRRKIRLLRHGVTEPARTDKLGHRARMADGEEWRGGRDVKRKIERMVEVHEEKIEHDTVSSHDRDEDGEAVFASGPVGLI